MIPIEWVTRRRAWGSFLRRHPDYRGEYCYPPHVETSFKDDSKHDPQWTEKQLVDAKLKIGPIVIGRDEVTIMKKTTVAAFEILERSWAYMDCGLIDIKVEFGVSSEGEILLGDVIENDSWRLWEDGDPKKMRDWQLFQTLYDNKEEVRQEVLDTVKEYYTWAANKSKGLMCESQGRVVVLMDNPSDAMHCEQILEECRDLGVPCQMRVTSADNGMEDTLQILAEYTGVNTPTVFIVVAGCNNSLGQVMSGHVCCPVIECPTTTSGAVITPGAAALQAAQILGLTDHIIWARLRARQLNSWISIKLADKTIRNDSKESVDSNW